VAVVRALAVLVPLVALAPTAFAAALEPDEVVVASSTAAVPASDVRARFEEAMDEITKDLPALVVTSKLRTEQDQARLEEQGYHPHPRSQHKAGLAWDCVAPEETLETLKERAVAKGLVALSLSSPVTGVSYLHVQRYQRSPGIQTAAVSAEPEAPIPAPVDEPEPAAAGAAEPEVEPPRPIGDAGFEFPRRLLRRKVEGRIVLLLDLSEQGDVLDLRVQSSDLPRFDEFVSDEVRGWKFAPLLREGRPVASRARFPISIRIQ
jgi:TonB family protein